MQPGEVIRRLRLEKGWSQEELAKRSGYAGRTAINKIEAGERDLSTSKVKEFAQIFDVSPLDILGVEYDLEKNVFITEEETIEKQDNKCGDVIKRLRENKGWSQQYLAERTGYRHKSSINKIELGLIDISTTQIKKFADIFNVSPLDILEIEHEEEKSIPADIDENTKRILAKFQKLNDQQKMAILSLMQTMIDE